MDQGIACITMFMKRLSIRAGFKWMGMNNYLSIRYVGVIEEYRTSQKSEKKDQKEILCKFIVQLLIHSN